MTDVTTSTESPGNLLRRSAAHLAGLEKDATPGTWTARGEWVATGTQGCTCGSPLWAGVPHEPGCGNEPIFHVGPEDAPLIAALRPAATLLVSIMYSAANAIDTEGSGSWRSEDERQEAMWRYAKLGYGRLLGYARSVLGETEG